MKNSTLFITDLLDFDGNALGADCIMRAFNQSGPDRDILEHSVAALLYSYTAKEIGIISLHHDIKYKRWRTDVWYESRRIASDVMSDWLRHGVGDIISLMDVVTLYVKHLVDTAAELPTIRFNFKTDFVWRDGIRIPKILDVDDLTLLQ